MERRNFFACLAPGTLAAYAAVPLTANAMEAESECKMEVQLKGEEIQHRVIFDFKSF